jgi:2',3'-cyclic-nucleotide 2'-phosphodiesterase (5'-nucleotidase family)
MKKLCFLLALLLLLTGCGKKPEDLGNNSTEARMVSFDVFAINDLHGRLTDTADQPGLDELSTYLKLQPKNTILLSTGDMWQGTSESNLTRGFIITDWMNRMDFTAMTVGGHEFDWGEEWLQKNIQMAQFPFLGINVYNRETDERVDYCQSSLVAEYISKGGLGRWQCASDPGSHPKAELTR